MENPTSSHWILWAGSGVGLQNHLEYELRE